MGESKIALRERLYREGGVREECGGRILTFVHIDGTLVCRSMPAHISTLALYTVSLRGTFWSTEWERWNDYAAKQ